MLRKLIREKTVTNTVDTKANGGVHLSNTRSFVHHLCTLLLTSHQGHHGVSRYRVFYCAQEGWGGRVEGDA